MSRHFSTRAGSLRAGRWGLIIALLGIRLVIPSAWGESPPPPSGRENREADDLASKVTRVDAVGHVRIIAGERTAVADKAVYYRDSEKIVLSGSPKVWERDNAVSGETITVFLDEDRSIVEDSVKVVFYPGQKAPPRSASAAPAKDKEDETLVVTSTRMEAEHQNRRVVFMGDVVVKRTGMILYADRVTVYYQ